MSQLPLSVLLNQLSLELGALQLMAADMEATVYDMIERNAGVLDARQAGGQVGGQSAVSGLKLASLAQRLSRGAGHAVTVQDEVYELFSDG